MNKKSTLILITILHICIATVCILTIYSRTNAEATVAHVSLSDKAPAPETEEASTETNTEASTEINTEIKTETNAEAEIIEEPETEAQTQTNTQAVLYTFHYNKGRRSNLNIREAPSMSAAIIGGIPMDGKGDVLELANDDWALIKYQDKTGYCSMNWITLMPVNP